jgi:deoxyribodipyrimidine photo-lyase
MRAMNRSACQKGKQVPKAPPVIVWFRDDLRLADHPALTAAAATGAPLICLYVFDENAAARPLGAASRWWLAQSLRALDADLRKAASELLLRRGPTVKTIAAIARDTAASTVFANRIYAKTEETLAQQLARSLKELSVDFKELPGDLLVDPMRIRGSSGGGMRVFTPFWKRVQALGDPAKPLPAPKHLVAAPRFVSDSIGAWKLEPTSPDWAGGLRRMWKPGEAGATSRLKEFLDEKALGYATQRDRPDRDATSRLSSHLRFGEISPRQVWHAARFAAARTPKIARDVEKFLSELGWREFCRHLLFDHPDMHRRNLQSSFDAFPWVSDAKALHAWQKGRTGYPIVDAGMRELWRTGVMHNRVRMVVASFLVKHLMIDWRAGEAWFWDTLVDADPGNNPANWQWVAGSGADAAPYFRIFNPILQGEKFDPDGDYVRRWVSEIGKLPNTLIHKPWMATPLELTSAGITLGETYPQPIVDHTFARDRALKAYERTRK